jgi:hypothetical protein
VANKPHLAELEEQYLGRVQTKSRISRRELLRSSAGGAVVTAVGMGGLLEQLLQSGPENNERGGHTHFVSIE